MGCELGVIQNGSCQALEIAKLLAEKKALQPNLANLKYITSYLLEDNKYASQRKWLAGMFILFYSNATLGIYAWDHEAESKFVKMLQQKFDLIEKGKAINESIKMMQKLRSDLSQTVTANKLKEECTANLKAAVNQLNLLHEIKSENRNKLLGDMQDYFRNILFQFYSYKHESKMKSSLTANDYCLWHFKCLRAYQCAELLINLQNVLNSYHQTENI